MASIVREENKKGRKQHEKKVLKRPLHLQATSRKGCMRGKGGPENMSCPFKGVRQRTWGKWVAEIREPNHGARLWLGTFSTSLEAAICFDAAARKLYGSYAKLNFPPRTLADTLDGANADEQMAEHVNKLQNLGAQMNGTQNVGTEVQNYANSTNKTDMQEQTEDQSMMLDINETTGLGKLDLNLPAEVYDSSRWE